MCRPVHSSPSAWPCAARSAHRGLSVAGARVVLVDGRVAATWSVKAGTVIVTPLRRFSRADRTTVAEQGRALALFLSDNDSHRTGRSGGVFALFRRRIRCREQSSPLDRR